jgi:hypothetical protein
MGGHILLKSETGQWPIPLKKRRRRRRRRKKKKKKKTSNVNQLLTNVVFC